MNTKYKTKPLTLSESIEEIWHTLAEVEEIMKLQEREILNLRARIKRLELTRTNEGADTLRLE